MLREYLETYRVYLERYPKAAKKARNRKKWLAMFGTPLEDAIFHAHPLVSFIPKEDQWPRIPVPLMYGEDFK